LFLESAEILVLILALLQREGLESILCLFCQWKMRGKNVLNLNYLPLPVIHNLLFLELLTVSTQKVLGFAPSHWGLLVSM